MVSDYGTSRVFSSLCPIQPIERHHVGKCREKIICQWYFYCVYSHICQWNLWSMSLSFQLTKDLHSLTKSSVREMARLSSAPLPNPSMTRPVGKLELPFVQNDVFDLGNWCRLERDVIGLHERQGLLRREVKDLEGYCYGDFFRPNLLPRFSTSHERGKSFLLTLALNSWY